VTCVLLQIMPDFYHFQHRKVSKRSLSSSSHVHRLLIEEPEVSASIQMLKLCILFSFVAEIFYMELFLLHFMEGVIRFVSCCHSILI